MTPLSRYLRPNEEIVWIGAPAPGYYRRTQQRQSFRFFASTFVVFAILSVIVPHAHNDDWVSWAGLSAIAALAVMIHYYLGYEASPPCWQYAVTNHRILSNYPTERTALILQVDLSNVKDTRLKDLGNEYGTISILLHKQGLEAFVDIECVPNAKDVQQIIDDARMAANRIPPP